MKISAAALSLHCKKILRTLWFKITLLMAIIAASAIAGMETDEAIRTTWKEEMEVTDHVLLIFFLAEFAMRLSAHYPKPQNYFKNGWNLFDMLIIGLTFLPTEGFFAIFRILRVLRVLRLINALPKLQWLVSAFVKSLPSISYVGLLLSIVFYIYAAIGTYLFGKNDPVHFGSMWVSFISLSHSVTLANWPELMYTQIYGSHVYGYNSPDIQYILQEKGMVSVHEPQPVTAVLYFLSFILFGALVVINLFIGVIMTAIQEIKTETEKKEQFKRLAELDSEIIGDVLLLTQTVEDLRNQIEKIGQRLENEKSGNKQVRKTVKLEE